MKSIGFNIGINTPRAGGGLSAQIAAMFADGKIYEYWDGTDTATLWQDTGATAAVTGDGDKIARIDGKGGVKNITQADSAKRFEFDLTGGIFSFYTDGVDDVMGFAAASLPEDCSIFCAARTTDAGGIFFSAAVDASSPWVGLIQDGNSGELYSLTGSGTPTIHVDGGAAQSNRDTFHDAVADGAWHAIEVRDADLSAWTGFHLSGRTNFPLAANVGPRLLVADESLLVEADRATITAWINQGVGL